MEQKENIEAKTYEELTDKQKRFVDFYIKYWNGAKAARLAGYEKDSAKNIASENLAKPYLRRIINERAALFVADEGEIATRLTTFARGSLKSFLGPNGEVDVTPENKNIDLAKKIKIKKRIVRPEDGDPIEFVDYEIEIEDRQSALDKLAKMRGMYKGENKQEETNPFADMTPEALLEELQKLGLKKVDDETNKGTTERI